MSLEFCDDCVAALKPIHAFKLPGLCGHVSRVADDFDTGQIMAGADFEVIGIMRRTAIPLPGADYTWRDDAGFGAIDAEACVWEAATVSDREDLTP